MILFVCLCLHLYIYPRERYALIITPLLVNAQRRLLERISSFGGPEIPQRHHVKTQKATGKEVEHTNTHKHFEALKPILKAKLKCNFFF